MSRSASPASVVAGLRKKFGEDAAILMGEAGRGINSVCPTGHAVLDRWVLGVGGLPYGRIVEMYGAESCLAADTRVNYAVVDAHGRLQNCKGGTIARLYERFHGEPVKGKGKYRRKASIGAHYTSPCMNEDGRIFHNAIVDVVKTGRQVCYELRTSGGLCIYATAEHKFWTGEAFVPLKQLVAGDTVMTHQNTRYRVAEHKKPDNRAYLYLRWHPVAGVKVVRATSNRTTGEKRDYAYFRVARSRLVVEGRLNKLPLDEYVRRLNSGAACCHGLVSLSRTDHVHHLDENVLNDDLGNLVVMSASAHGMQHSRERHNNLRFAATPDTVLHVLEAGGRDTYDIRMASPFNNYIADGFVVHNSGKTTMMNTFLAGVQRDNGIAVLCETEHSYDPAWAKSLGVDVDNLVLLQPNYLDGEDGALAQFENVITRSGDRPVLIALDSVAATPTQREFKDGVSGDAAMCEAARCWSKGLRTLAATVAKHGAILLLVNQIRAKPGVMYGPTETTPGGNAIKFYASVRLAVHHGKKVEGGDGRYMGVTAVKNKICPPYRKAQLRLDNDGGFNERWAVMNHAKEMGCVASSCRSYKEAVAALDWSDLQETEKGEANEASEDTSAE